MWFKHNLTSNLLCVLGRRTRHNREEEEMNPSYVRINYTFDTAVALPSSCPRPMDVEFGAFP